MFERAEAPDGGRAVHAGEPLHDDRTTLRRTSAAGDRSVEPSDIGTREPVGHAPPGIVPPTVSALVDDAPAGSRVQRAASALPIGASLDGPDGQRVQPAVQGAIRDDSGPVIRRANAFYSGSPRSEAKESPLATIARGLHDDVGVSPDAIRQHWLTTDTLRVAKTAKTNLTAAPMQSFERPIEAAAWLDTPNPRPGQRKDPAWITAVGNLGTVEDQIQGDTPQKYNGGHLVAWEFLNDAANVRGNVAPQSDLQNQALFRRVERVLEHTVASGGTGIELIVETPYQGDGYTVTYRQLFERKVLADAQLHAELEQRGLLDRALTFSQMAPDTYSVRYLTQTGTTSMVPPDAREGREGIVSHQLPDYSDEASDALVRGGLPKLSVLATNYDPELGDQQIASFAHVVFLNHRSQAPPPPSVAAAPSSPEAERDDRERRQRALAVMQEHQQLTIQLLQHLEIEFGYSPTQASEALIALLLRSETDDGGEVGRDSMDTT